MPSRTESVQNGKTQEQAGQVQQGRPTGRPISLAVVIPVYNEQQRLKALLDDWIPVFEKEAGDFRVILIDDGSKDDSLNLLYQRQQIHPRLDVHTQPNAGHGPSILKGYRLAQDAEWVFQIDSDHQLETNTFPELWRQRENYDLLLGQRKEKTASKGRQRLSLLTASLIRLIFGKAVADVNTPYRLIRASELKMALEKIPAGSFAPNVLMTAWIAKKRKRIFTAVVSVRTEGQRESRLNSYILRGAIRSCVQTLLFRIKL